MHSACTNLFHVNPEIELFILLKQKWDSMLPALNNTTDTVALNQAMLNCSAGGWMGFVACKYTSSGWHKVAFFYHKKRCWRACHFTLLCRWLCHEHNSFTMWQQCWLLEGHGQCGSHTLRVAPNGLFIDHLLAQSSHECFYCVHSDLFAERLYDSDYLCCIYPDSLEQWLSIFPLFISHFLVPFLHHFSNHKISGIFLKGLLY